MARDPRRPRGYRYGRWTGGADPLAPPYDVRAAVDELGERIMEGSSVRDAMRELMRDGLEGRGGLDALRERLRKRREALKRSGDLAGPVKQAREALEAALADERAVIEAMDAAESGQDPLPGEERVLREMTLDALPRSTAGAVRALSDYDWLSPTARETYEKLLEDLRAQALRAQLGAGALGPEGVEGGEGEGQQGQRSTADLKDLLADLNTLLGKHAKGTDTDQDFADFMAKHGDAFPEDPKDVDELIDALAQRAAAMDRLMRSLSKSERAQMQQLMAAAMEDADLAAEMSALSANLADLRPGAFGGRGERFEGGEPMGFDQGAAALGELSDLDALEESLSMGDPLHTLDDVDVEAVERQLGPGAAAQVEALRRLERELAEQGWLTGRGDELSLAPKALRQLGQSALAKVFADLRAAGRGGHDERSAGAAGEATGATRAWTFGDEQPLDAVATVRRAVLRSAGEGTAARTGREGGTRGASGRLRLVPEDFAVVETERRSSGGGGAVRGPVVLDVRRGPLGLDEADRAGPGAPDRHPLPPGRPAGHRLRAHRRGADHRAAGRGGAVDGAGHQPPARPRPGPAPRRAPPHLPAGGPGGHRRRADRSPRRGRVRPLRVADVGGDPARDPDGGGRDDPRAHPHHHVRARGGPGPAPLRRRHRPAQRRPGDGPRPLAPGRVRRLGLPARAPGRLSGVSPSLDTPYAPAPPVTVSVAKAGKM